MALVATRTRFQNPHERDTSLMTSLSCVTLIKPLRHFYDHVNIEETVNPEIPKRMATFFWFLSRIKPFFLYRHIILPILYQTHSLEKNFFFK